MNKQEQLEQNESNIDRARYVLEMKQSKGWVYAEELIENAKQDYIDSSEKDLLKNYNKFKVLLEFKSKLDDMINDAELATKNINKLK